MIIAIEVEVPVSATRKDKQAALLSAAEFSFYTLQVGESNIKRYLLNARIPDPRSENTKTADAYKRANAVLRVELRKP